jgi:Tfp pilus assembly protein PilN
MPIRLNLLAEAQAEEELRRRDPVKRSIWLAGLLVCCVLVWSGILLIKSFTLRSTLNQIESRLGGQNNRYQQIVENQKHLAEVQQRLQALHRLAANRFLWGNVLNALQQATLDDVQLNRFRSAQNYTATEETKPKTF